MTVRTLCIRFQRAFLNLSYSGSSLNVSMNMQSLDMEDMLIGSENKEKSKIAKSLNPASSDQGDVGEKGRRASQQLPKFGFVCFALVFLDTHGIIKHRPYNVYL